MLYLAGGGANDGRAVDWRAVFVFYGAGKRKRSCAVADLGMHTDHYRIFNLYDWPVGGCDRGQQEAAAGYPVSCEENGVRKVFHARGVGIRNFSACSGFPQPLDRESLSVVSRSVIYGLLRLWES